MSRRKPWGDLSKSQQWRNRRAGITPEVHTALRRREASYARMSPRSRAKLRKQEITRSDYVRAVGAKGRPGSQRLAQVVETQRTLGQRHAKLGTAPVGGLSDEQLARLRSADDAELRTILRGRGDDRDIAEHLWYKRTKGAA
jgi:hypothetical protein